MRQLLTADAMREVDRAAVEEGGMDIKELMSRAGEGLWRESQGLAASRLVVLAGGGNNGGDGLYAAALAARDGVKATALLLTEKLSPAAAWALSVARDAGVEVRPFDEWRDALSPDALVMDALFGTGFRGSLPPSVSAAAEEVAKAGLDVVAADIPSGVNGTTGEVAGAAFRCVRTVTFAFLKTGHFLHPGKRYCGDVRLVDIGLPREATGVEPTRLFEVSDVSRLIPPLRGDEHKGTMGRVLVAAGSVRYSGAALLTATAAARSGAGIVTLAVSEQVVPLVAGHAPHLILVGVPSEDGYVSEALFDEADPAGFDAVVVGPGLGRTEAVSRVVRRLSSLGSPTVFDADALRFVEPGSLHANCVVTPHAGEAGVMLSVSAEEVVRDRLSAVRRLAERTGAVALLKGAPTLVCDGSEVSFNSTGNVGLATGGTGDVLAGVIGALLGRGLPAFDAARVGACVHGLAGDVAAERLGALSLVSPDVVAALPAAFSEVVGGT